MQILKNAWKSTHGIGGIKMIDQYDFYAWLRKNKDYKKALEIEKLIDVYINDIHGEWGNKASINDKEIIETNEWDNWKCFINMIDKLELLIIYDVLFTLPYDIACGEWFNKKCLHKHYLVVT